MTKVIFDMSTSLDGFVKASKATPEQPLGEDGEQLHEWVFGEDERDREVLARGESLGALICGRRTYDDSVRWWGADGPTGERRLPVFVVTHEAPEESPEGGVFTFVTDGIEGALERAKAAAGDKDVAVSGADVGQQLVRVGLVDEIGVHLVPVLFGGGTRMFERLGDEHIRLETVEAIETAAATHLRYRVKHPDTSERS
jgi:dihydrofolate reductase